MRANKSVPFCRFRERRWRGSIKQVSFDRQRPDRQCGGHRRGMSLDCRVLAVSTAPTDAPSLPWPLRVAARRPKLIFLVTEDWYFWSHRLPIARAARDAGFEIVVASRERVHGDRIRAEGFRFEALRWRRRGDRLAGAARAVAAIAALYRRERPDIVHHVALKPVLFGAAAVRLAFPRRTERPSCVAAVNGLGSGFSAASGAAGLSRTVLCEGLRRAAEGARVIVQNPEDREALAALGIDPARIVLIRGSGVDTAHFAPLPEPGGPVVKAALVGRMLRSKGVLDAVAAVRLLRAEGVAVELILAGPTDPDNPDSLDDRTLRARCAEPGVRWLGRIEDVREVWAEAAIAVLPSTYGEGLPKALLEAASCGRAIVASDMPGCREIARPAGPANKPGEETGLLVPPGDVTALSRAIGALARDKQRRRAMGRAGRHLVEREFGEDRIAAQTLALYEGALRERGAGR
jgi:glycosyltransferase involved in cell wall biosynthesis